MHLTQKEWLQGSRMKFLPTKISKKKDEILNKFHQQNLLNGSRREAIGTSIFTETDSALMDALIKSFLRPLFTVTVHQRDGRVKDEASSNRALICTGRARVWTQHHLVIRGDARPGQAAQPVRPPEHHFLPRQLCPDLVKSRAEPRDLRLVQPLRHDHEVGGAGTTAVAGRLALWAADAAGCKRTGARRRRPHRRLRLWCRWFHWCRRSCTPECHLEVDSAEISGVRTCALRC
jgi:hypothetical protein